MVTSSAEILSGLQMADHLRAGATSSEELVENALAAADSFDKEFGVFITRLDDEARSWAADADARRADGDSRPLLGVPFAVKDLHPLAGVPCTMGSAAIPAMVAPVDSGTVGRLRGAGLIPIGTTNASEFGASCFTHTESAGDARNPWDPSKSASGSSGGSAAAVAAGIVPWAHASDGAGSIRLPASVCGLVGLKPSRGVTPEQGPSFIGFGVEGFLARTAADASTLFEVLAAEKVGGLHEIASHPIRQDKFRVAVCTDAGSDVDVDAAAVTATLSAGKALEAVGYEVTEIDYPFPEFRDVAPGCMLDVFSVSISATVGLFLTPETIELLQPYSRFLLERGNEITSAQLVSALSRLAVASGQALSAQQEFDVLITPTTTRPQVAVDEFWLDFGEQSFAAMAQWARFVGVANCTGQPAISVPVGVDDAGLPQGVQLLAGRGHDRTLLHLAAQLEDALPWSQRRPLLARSGSSVRLGSPEE